jgi:hypothetical protein
MSCAVWNIDMEALLAEILLTKWHYQPTEGVDHLCRTILRSALTEGSIERQEYFVIWAASVCGMVLMVTGQRRKVERQVYRTELSLLRGQ